MKSVLESRARSLDYILLSPLAGEGSGARGRFEFQERVSLELAGLESGKTV